MFLLLGNYNFLKISAILYFWENPLGLQIIHFCGYGSSRIEASEVSGGFFWRRTLFRFIFASLLQLCIEGMIFFFSDMKATAFVHLLKIILPYMCASREMLNPLGCRVEHLAPSVAILFLKFLKSFSGGQYGVGGLREQTE